MFLAGGFGAILDPTPFSFAATGALIWAAIFRRDLFTFSPVARALIKAREGDTVVLRTPAGKEELDILEVSYPEPAPAPDLDGDSPI